MPYWRIQISRVDGRASFVIATHKGLFLPVVQLHGQVWSLTVFYEILNAAVVNAYAGA